MKIKYPEIGICGLSCRLCPWYHKDKNRCNGCKSKYRMSAGCPFITCAIKNKKIEFCWECSENHFCEKWKKHRDAGKKKDSFKCYQKLEDDILFIQKNGIDLFIKEQKIREKLLNLMLKNFNEGRSKSYYCIASTIFKVNELKEAIDKAIKQSNGLSIKKRSDIIHKILDDYAKKNNYYLKLRK
jgi:hypothetical protein